MEDDPNFLAPGSDGELGPGSSLWRKGLVYTTRTGAAPLSIGQNYRISVGFKRGIGAAHPFTGFQDVYRRVATIANHRISQMTCPETGEKPVSIILCHGWRCLGDGDNIVTALITLGLRCSDQRVDAQGETVPTEEALRSPGGATLEELARLAPQRADEVYNEFDFTEPSTPDTNPVTLSYGEPISSGDIVDFRPFVERAERLACSYHSLLQTLGEAGAQPFRIKRREWFLASQTFVTIHICFDR